MYPSSLPNIDLQVLPTFPAHVQGSGPITVSKSGLTYTFGSDFRQIMHTTALTPVADYHALLQNVETGSFHRASLADIYANFDPPNGSIGNDKLADMPEATVKGRPAGSGTGAPQDITVSQALDSIGDDVGTLAVRGAAGWEGLAPGDQWKVLTSMGAGAVPQWVDNTPANNTVTDAKVHTPASAGDPNAVKATKIAVTASGTLPDLSVQDAIEHFDETTARSFPTVADLQAYDPASPPAYVRTAGYHATGDLGGALYKYSATEPTHPGKVQSADGSWWEIAEPVIRLKQLGATDLSDVADLLEGIFPLRRQIIVDGVYQVSRQVSYDGPVRITGADDTAELHWPSTNTTGGLKFRPTQAPSGWWDYFEIGHVKLTTDAVAQWDAINIDWYDLDVPIPYFYVRARIHHNRIMGVPLIGQGQSDSYGWANCIYLNFPFSVTIDNNYLMGAWERVANPSSINSFYSHSAVYVPNQSKRTLAYLRLFDNTIFNFQYGVRVFNMEGVWCVNNDFQVCWRAAWFVNTISPVNQYRFFGNHIGVYETHIYVENARQVLIENNEISYRFGRTDGGDVSMIVLDGVYSGAIIGNSIRGNVFNTTDVGVDGILLINNGRTVGNTRCVSIDGNQFQNLRNSIKLRQTATDNVIGPSNTYDNMMAGGRHGWQIFDNSCIQPGHMGSGVMPLPAGQSPALYLTNKGAGALTVGREGADGAAVTFTKDGVSVGSISVTGSATAYNTTSDYRLKTNIRDLDGSGEFIDALRPRRFEMGGVEMAGFIAHEFAEVSPMSVTGEKDAVDEHGNPIYQAMQASTSEVMAHIVAELQSLRKRMAKLDGGE